MSRVLGLAVLAACVLASAAARADPLRILVAVSHTRGAPGEMPLRHAAADVDAVARVLTTLGGFSLDAAQVLRDPSVAQLDAAFDRARGLAASHAPGEVTFLFYFSGHGDRDRIHLGPEGLAMTDVTARARAVPASLRVLVTDACRTYPSRFKGISTEPGFAISGSTTNPADGVVWLYGSGEGEPAQESDELNGALFTHFWVSSLSGAGDANGDGRVTLAESYDFAYSQTLLRSSRASGVLQHPAAVFDLREAGPIVLTRMFETGTALVLPRSADAHYLVYSLGSRAVLGETWSNPDREVAFAIPAGRYIVQRRSPAGSGALEVALAARQVRTLDANEFRPFAQEELASKGGTVVLRPNEVSVGVEAETTRLSSYGGALAIRYARVVDEWALSLGLAGGYGAETTSAEGVTLGSVAIDAIMEHRNRLGPLGLGLGVGAAADLLWEGLERADAVRVAAAGYPTTQHFFGVAAGPVARVSLRAQATRGVWIGLSLRGGTLFANLDGGIGAIWTLGGGVQGGLSF